MGRPVEEVHWGRDGAWMIIAAGGQQSYDIFALETGTDDLIPLLTSEYNEFEPRLSPDGRWLAYVSDESGFREVYLRPFPNVNDGRWLVSIDGGAEPVWGRSGEELFYRSADATSVLVADMSNGPASLTRRLLFTLPAGNDYESNFRNHLIDVAADGRFIMIEREGSPDISGDLVIVRGFEKLLEGGN